MDKQNFDHKTHKLCINFSAKISLEVYLKPAVLAVEKSDPVNFFSFVKNFVICSKHLKPHSDSEAQNCTDFVETEYADFAEAATDYQTGLGKKCDFLLHKKFERIVVAAYLGSNSDFADKLLALVASVNKIFVVETVLDFEDVVGRADFAADGLIIVGTVHTFRILAHYSVDNAGSVVVADEWVVVAFADSDIAVNSVADGDCVNPPYLAAAGDDSEYFFALPVGNRVVLDVDFDFVDSDGTVDFDVVDAVVDFDVVVGFGDVVDVVVGFGDVVGVVVGFGDVVDVLVGQAVVVGFAVADFESVFDFGVGSAVVVDFVAVDFDVAVGFAVDFAVDIDVAAGFGVVA
ncbi:hypothetical protein HK099_000851 [Clydaea vesicula]|uniref:Uncharacterized protein n=1 Tax=Clydaea vesicula TaxID=447962 RepID=A0AAD5U3Z2_9FUNG|nr:hypothetical protein HK099_000851 [Clydaea vesicula]